MSWYDDYVSPVMPWNLFNTVKGGFSGPGEMMDSAARQSHAYLDNAQADNRAGGQALQNYYAGAKQNAQAYYGPLQQMFQSAYGTQGLQSPKLPRGGQ